MACPRCSGAFPEFSLVAQPTAASRAYPRDSEHGGEFRMNGGEFRLMIPVTRMLDCTDED